ncbi:MAG: hypothetical protein F6K39_00800 [Okeania sp. SIO3B3]|nr:hypothetical protein [Okeania sp. SIO3B3]
MNTTNPINQIFTKTATVVSAAVLAFSAATSASAISFEFGSDGEVVGITDLDVEGQLYDVEFVSGSYSEVFAGTFDFDSFAPAFAAALALVEALGDDKFTGIFRGSTLDVLSDSFAKPPLVLASSDAFSSVGSIFQPFSLILSLYLLTPDS